MKPAVARLITYAVVASLAAAALAYVRPLPERQVGDLLKADDAPEIIEHVDSLSRGETLGTVLQRGGMNTAAIAEVLQAATSIDPRRIPAGMRVTFGSATSDSVPRMITLRLTVDRVLQLTRSDSGWTAREDTLPWRVDTTVVRGAISSNLYDALDASSDEFPRPARTELAWDVADIFEFRIDMSRDLQVGDAFSVLVERRSGPEGVVRPGRVLAATFSNGGTTIEAFRKDDADGRTHYYDQYGKSMQANFLLAPLSFRRISSVFGLRKHPILGITRKHEGTDYAANAGTPVRSVGDGVVIFAGRKGGYGNAIDVRHANGYVTRYGHLRGFASGVHAGTRVAMGQTIGYVGMTGLATAPHLHFEVLVGGVARNPRTALASKSGTPLPDAERPLFESLKARYLALLDRGTSHLADNNN